MTPPSSPDPTRRADRRRFVRRAIALTLVGSGSTSKLLCATSTATPAPQPTQTAFDTGAHNVTTASSKLWLPMMESAASQNNDTSTPPTSSETGVIVASASGSDQSAINWLSTYANQAEYPPSDVAKIVRAYQVLGDSVGVDWFLALAQLCHETGSLTSWWSARPRRNPAGIGVTGKTQAGTQDSAPAGSWAWDSRDNLWREGVSFATWVDDGIPAHLGRLLAYALNDWEATSPQRVMISKALSYRSLTSSLRGSAPLITGLNGRWAYPGTEYGQRILALAERMRAF